MIKSQVALTIQGTNQFALKSYYFWSKIRTQSSNSIRQNANEKSSQKAYYCWKRSFFVKPYIKGRAIFILFTVNESLKLQLQFKAQINSR